MRSAWNIVGVQTICSFNQLVLHIHIKHTHDTVAVLACARILRVSFFLRTILHLKKILPWVNLIYAFTMERYQHPRSPTNYSLKNKKCEFCSIALTKTNPVKFALCFSSQILYRNKHLFIKILNQIIRIKIQFAGKER